MALVSAAWLADHLDEVIVADVRWSMTGPSGRDLYREGHIPGAHFVDLDEDLSNPAAPGGRHPLPRPDYVASMISRIGYDGARRIVAYDDRHGAVAARLWWTLRYFGLAECALLDGGLQAWLDDGGGLSTDVPAPSDATVPMLSPRLEMTVQASDVATRGEDVLLLDARSGPRFRGEEEPIDSRAGHIPGAVNAHWEDNLENGRMASPEALEKRYSALGLTSERAVIAYCGSGVTACHDLLALSLIGRDDARLYVGSWSDWSSDPNRPGATGDLANKEP